MMVEETGIDWEFREGHWHIKEPNAATDDERRYPFLIAEVDLEDDEAPARAEVAYLLVWHRPDDEVFDRDSPGLRFDSFEAAEREAKRWCELVDRNAFPPPELRGPDGATA